MANVDPRHQFHVPLKDPMRASDGTHLEGSVRTVPRKNAWGLWASCENGIARDRTHGHFCGQVTGERTCARLAPFSARAAA